MTTVSMISLNNSGIHFCKKKHEIWRICWQLVIFLYAMHGRQYLKLLLIDHANQYKGVKSKIKYPKSPHIWFRIERIGPEVARFLFYESRGKVLTPLEENVKTMYYCQSNDLSNVTSFDVFGSFSLVLCHFSFKTTVMAGS